MPLYVGLSTLGSVGGCLALFTVGRKGGELFLRRRFKPATVDRALAFYQRWGRGAIAVPAMLPPPTPFKLLTLLAGAAGMQPATFAFSVTAGRVVRYLIEGILAVEYRRPRVGVSRRPSRGVRAGAGGTGSCWRTCGGGHALTNRRLTTDDSLMPRPTSRWIPQSSSVNASMPGQCRCPVISSKNALRVHGPAEESLHEHAGSFFAAASEDLARKRPPDLGVHQLRAKRRQHVERDHFGPHVAVVARRVAAGDVRERAGELRPRQIAERSSRAPSRPRSRSRLPGLSP